MDINEIIELLPHRYPFLLVDRVVSYEENKTISVYKNVTYNEHFFQGHFPGNPIMPGVLIVEAMVQAGGLLYMLSTKNDPKKGTMYFMGMDKVKFRRPVVPGDRLDIKTEAIRFGSRGIKFRGQATVGDAKAAEGEFLATIVAAVP
ncbi:MAG: 3-hydroxyacyl-ACP dehydratase FabZ [Deltaproteobacteria bacterium]|nr:3-hydroxyacyl-ACP dehydratase FabZ [Deltaproteobacteria bacterium]MBW2052752.1 3-hydroxyacyl-ACP dehydratase FabZ [Deltaproteobacteria bacterium]MBW2139807.1 3-hydroxyacyl-ACP dehydratase FabZ [Deltaproteobacteria bacterium]MBW2322711.1 3-hydroxyacyl-ACP dehydratase FabZ [Deltaproteobacteria bacterium]